MRYGHECWVTRDYGSEGKGLYMSKARLGEFMWYLLKYGGTVTDCYAMAKSPRAYCQFAISLPSGASAAFQAESGFILEKPPVLKLA